MKPAWVWALTAVLVVLAVFNDRRWKQLEVFDYDPGGYYAYLPATFLYGDAGRADSLVKLLRAQRPDRTLNLGLVPLPGARFITKYPLGVALAQLPWFAGAHGWARATGQPPTGASRPYQQAAMLAGVFYALLGLWLLRRLLQHVFPAQDAVVAWALAAVGLGTNFFCYASFEAAFAHGPLFLWHTALLTCVVRWHETFRAGHALGIGVFLGLAVLTRHSEILYALVPLAWGVTGWTALAQRPALLARHGGQVLLAGAAAGALVGLQLLFWRLVAGQWLLDTYAGEGFDFRHPHVVEGLLSYRKGWLLYTPLAGLMLLGWPALRHRLPAAVLPVALLVPAVVYVTFSWRQWAYGGGFSARPLVSLYPLLALPLAALLSGAQAAGRGRWAMLRTVVALLCALNLWQTWQYSGNIIPFDSNTKARYWHNFFTTSLRNLRP